MSGPPTLSPPLAVSPCSIETGRRSALAPRAMTIHNTMSDVLTQLKALDAMTAEGKILETLDIYFADDCRFIEVINGDSRDSLKAQHAHLSGFFATLKGFNGATLRGHAVNGDQSFSEWTFDMVAGDGSSIVWNEVLVRRWKDGKVIEEKYYNASA